MHRACKTSLFKLAHWLSWDNSMIELGFPSHAAGFRLLPLQVLSIPCSRIQATALQVLFTLPTSFPVTLESFNYASVALGAVLAGCITAWFLPSCGARHWYQGPKAAMDNAAANDPESRQLI